MRHAGHFLDIFLGKYVVEPGITIRMDPAFERGEMSRGVFAFTVRTELVPSCGWIAAAPRAFIPDIGPDPSRGALLLSLHSDRSIVSEDRLTRADISPNNIRQRFQKLRRLPDPSRQR